jgi:hypothetical protein
MKQRKLTFKAWLLLSLFAFLNSSCSGNVYSNFVNANGYGDQGAYSNMVLNMNNSKWTAAIANYTAMSTTFQNTRAVQNLYAQSLAGACGFSFLNLFYNISNTSSSLPTFLWIMNLFSSTTITMAEPGITAASASATTDTYCSHAQQIMDNIKSTYGSLNSDEQLFVAVFGLARIGMNLKYWLDPAGTGAVISTQDICTAGSAGIPDFYLRQVATGLSQFYLNIAALGSTAGSSTTFLKSFCSSYPSICNTTDPSSYSSSTLKEIRSILTLQYSGDGASDGSAGLGMFANGSAVQVLATDGGTRFQCNGSGSSAGILLCCH